MPTCPLHNLLAPTQGQLRTVMKGFSNVELHNAQPETQYEPRNLGYASLPLLVFHLQYRARKRGSSSITVALRNDFRLSEDQYECSPGQLGRAFVHRSSSADDHSTADCSSNTLTGKPGDSAVKLPFPRKVCPPDDGVIPKSFRRVVTENFSAQDSLMRPDSGFRSSDLTISGMCPALPGDTQTITRKGDMSIAREESISAEFDIMPRKYSAEVNLLDSANEDGVVLR
ncbi:hypothetical protein Bbelb_125410 [Branchiostoma belcheri]|nr:hypothetical protein Bbelb_125410 [Branchiostoma belcheri]